MNAHRSARRRLLAALALCGLAPLPVLAAQSRLPPCGRRGRFGAWQLEGRHDRASAAKALRFKTLRGKTIASQGRVAFTTHQPGGDAAIDLITVTLPDPLVQQALGTLGRDEKALQLSLYVEYGGGALDFPATITPPRQAGHNWEFTLQTKVPDQAKAGGRDPALARAALGQLLTGMKFGGLAFALHARTAFEDSADPACLQRAAAKRKQDAIDGNAPWLRPCYPEQHDVLLAAADQNDFRDHGEALHQARKLMAVESERYRNKQCSSGCFVTTACCEMVGLADDCWELRTLRQFRDTRLAALPGGPADIARYYRAAPALVASLATCHAGRRRLLGLYWRDILPCALLARLGLARACHRRYRRMMQRLGA